MTSTTFFSGSSPSPSATRAPAAARVQAAPAVAARRSVAAASPVYAWMTQAMLAGMSPRARRLLRADY